MNHEEKAPVLNRTREGESVERYLAFSLRSEQYAIPLLEVKEVIGMTPPTPVPRAPNYFVGIINLRGQVIAVVDLRAKLQLPKAADGPETSIIILDVGDGCLGVIVDSINSVLALNPEDLSPPPEAIGRDRYLRGVARKDDRLTLLLDLKATLSVQDMAALRSTTQAA